MSDYGIRVTVTVDCHDEHGVAESLQVEFADFVAATTPADAAHLAASWTPDRIAHLLQKKESR